ncbi:MAG: Trk system potassium transporter TrkA [Oscillospiraceae bacterium]|nr:Trk system potassium transporter TrkA [Oscillospiraceae bacterium]
MRILIVGNGKVGYTLAESLASEKHDITVIDKDYDALSSAAERLDVMHLKGNGASISTLKQAGAENAGIVIAVTMSDEVNMLCCLTAKKLGAKHTIARIRDPEYVRDVSMFKRQLDIDLVINPERSTAAEIMRLLRFPAAVEIDTFSGGQIELVGLRVIKDDFICGMSIKELRKKTKAEILICIVERGGNVHIPRGDFVIESGDLVFVAGMYTDITKFFRAIGRTTSMAENVMILGGGKTAYYLAAQAHRVGIKSVIIEVDEAKCARLAEGLPHATVINGDGMEQELLESENIRGMDAFAALTRSDEENLIISLFANQCGVRKVVAKADRQNYAPFVKSLGVESVISPKEITVNHILHFVRGLTGSRGGSVKALYRLLDGRVEALEFVVSRDMRGFGEKIKDLPIKSGVVIAAISHSGKSIVPDGHTVLKEGDNVVVVTVHPGFDELNDIFERQ